MTLKPDGTPEVVTETVPVKPPKGAIATCTLTDDPGAIDGEEGVTEILNEGGGGGGCPDEPPPQLASKKELPIRKIALNRCAAIR